MADRETALAQMRARGRIAFEEVRHAGLSVEDLEELRAELEEWLSPRRKKATMPGCCLECAELKGFWHAFAVGFAARGEGATAKLEAYREAGGTAKTDVSAQQVVSRELLKNVELQASIKHHRAQYVQKEEEFGEELRRLEEVQSRGNVFDLFVSQNPDSDCWSRLETLFVDGVERMVDGHRKMTPPTHAEKLRAAQDCVALRQKAPRELTEDQQMMAESITIDPRGKVVVGLGRGPARARIAKLRGLNAAVEVNVEVDKGRQLLLEAVEAEQGALLDLLAVEDVPESVHQAASGLVDGVLRRLGGAGRGAAGGRLDV